jgi:hypothetical protein
MISEVVNTRTNRYNQEPPTTVSSLPVNLENESTKPLNQSRPLNQTRQWKSCDNYDNLNEIPAGETYKPGNLKKNGNEK